jgi:hypothetical protein
MKMLTLLSVVLLAGCSRTKPDVEILNTDDSPIQVADSSTNSQGEPGDATGRAAIAPAGDRVDMVKITRRDHLGVRGPQELVVHVPAHTPTYLEVGKLPSPPDCSSSPGQGYPADNPCLYDVWKIQVNLRDGNPIIIERDNPKVPDRVMVHLPAPFSVLSDSSALLALNTNTLVAADPSVQIIVNNNSAPPQGTSPTHYNCTPGSCQIQVHYSCTTHIIIGPHDCTP